MNRRCRVEAGTAVSIVVSIGPGMSGGGGSAGGIGPILGLVLIGFFALFFGERGGS